MAAAHRTWPTIRRVLAQGWSHRYLTLAALASTMVMSMLLGYSVLVMNRIFTLFSAIQSSAPQADASAAQAIVQMRSIALRLLLLSPVLAGSAYASWYTGQLLANRCMQELRNRFLSHLISLDLAYHASLSRGDLITRMTADLNNLLNLQRNVYGKLMQRPFEAAFFIITLFALDWRFAGIVFLVLAPIGALVARIVRKTRHRSIQAQQAMAANVVAFEQITAGVRVIKAMGSTSREIERYAGANQGLFIDNMRLARARSQSELITQGSLYFLTAVALFAGSLLFAQHWITPAMLLASLVSLGRLTTVLREIQRVWGDTQECVPAAERVFAVLDRPSRIVDRADARPCPVPRQAIRLEDVHFRYSPESEDVLRGVTLEIPVGSTVALVGESGAGKSTVLDLIPRFHDVTGGRITIDGIDIRDLQHDSLVHQCAIVQQDSFLFNDTIYRNILYGRPEASRAEVEAAARRAHVHDAILGLEGGLGYDTVVGDRGSRLSGGQRQRIAIARALLRDAPILLLDEPTSALDADSERHVQEALTELMRGRTTIVVAHRLATIQHADRIYVFAPKRDAAQAAHAQRGTVVETGTHRDLVAHNGIYAQMARMQQLQR